MADFFPADELEKRQIYRCPAGTYYRNGRCYERSAWYYWGRWVLAGVLVIIFILVLCALGSRRRKKRGMQPMYGTGWMANGYNPNQQQPAQYGYNQQQPYGQQQYPQQYGQQGLPAYNYAQNTGTTYNRNDGYYGGHNEGIQLQQPQNAYAPRGADNEFSPPPGPPPNKVA